MSEYRFSTNQRFAVYKAFNGVCQWCREPVPFQNFHVDHVLPEELLNDPAKLQAILHTYSLPASFSINDYENWIPAHPYCNQGKSDKVYEGAPFIRTILDSCAGNKEREQRMEFKLNQEPKKAEILTKVQAAIQQNLVNLQELQNFILKSDIMDSQDEELNQIRRGLEQKMEYQTDQMVGGIMELLKSHTKEVLKSIREGLGKDWSKSILPLNYRIREPNPYVITESIRNKVNSRFSVSIVVFPKIQNNELIIKFINESREVGTLRYDLKEGIDWQEYRTVLRSHYKSALNDKLK